MEIKRDLYLNKLISLKHNGLIKVITGIRRCGKSYLLNDIFYNHLLESGVDEKHIIRFAFDSGDDLSLIGESIIEVEKHIQICQKFENHLNNNKKYLDYLEDSSLLESAQRYDIKGKAYIETPKKYYFSDMGLRNARINFRQFEQTHAMENVIYNELRMRGYRVDVGVVPVTEKNKEGKTVRKQLEVDFICNLGSMKYYIQSAFSIPDEEKRAQEIRPFKKIDDSFKKIVITKDIVPAYYDENRILTMNIYDFLMDEKSLEK